MKSIKSFPNFRPFHFYFLIKYNVMKRPGKRDFLSPFGMIGKLRGAPDRNINSEGLRIHWTSLFDENLADCLPSYFSVGTDSKFTLYLVRSSFDANFPLIFENKNLEKWYNWPFFSSHKPSVFPFFAIFLYLYTQSAIFQLE